MSEATIGLVSMRGGGDGGEGAGGVVAVEQGLAVVVFGE